MNSKKKILVGINQSVDSFATLLLLKLQGFDVTAMHVQVADPTQYPVQSCEKGELDQMRTICQYLNIPFSLCEFRELYLDQVVAPFFLAKFLKEYSFPCQNCHGLKVRALYKKMLEGNFSNIATGHYAKCKPGIKEGQGTLARAGHAEFDQHRLLAGLDGKILDRLILPLSDMTKTDVAKIVDGHLLKYKDLFKETISEKRDNSCTFVNNFKLELQKKIPPSLHKKARLHLREKKMTLSDSVESIEIDFGHLIPIPDAKKERLNYIVTGFNYSQGLVTIDYENNKGFNYLFFQISQVFSDFNRRSALAYKAKFNNEDEDYSGTVFFKSLNYGLFFMNKAHFFIPSKSLIFFYDESKIPRLLFTAKVITQSFRNDQQTFPWESELRKSDDFDL